MKCKELGEASKYKKCKKLKKAKNNNFDLKKFHHTKYIEYNWLKGPNMFRRSQTMLILLPVSKPSISMGL